MIKMEYPVVCCESWISVLREKCKMRIIEVDNTEELFSGSLNFDSEEASVIDVERRAQAIYSNILITAKAGGLK